MAVLTLWSLATADPPAKVVGPLASIQVADQAAGQQPRWSPEAYCRPHRDNTLSSRELASRRVGAGRAQ
jgi:hypothetical protein